MASPQDLHINFLCSGNDFNIHLIKDKKSNYSVQINGITYAILGDEDKLPEAHKILNFVNLDSVYTIEDLKGRLLARKGKDISFPEIPITKGIAASTLKVEHKEFGAWKLAEDQDIAIKNYVAECLWSNKDKLSPGLKGLLGETEVNQAIQTNDDKAFNSIISTLSSDQIWDIRTKEQINPLGTAKKSCEITQADLDNLRSYLDDIHFSGSVSLSDAKGTYCICSTGKEFLEKTPFSINSAAKLFTGALALMEMPSNEKSNAFDEPLQLHQKTLDYLKKEKPPIYDRIQGSKLIQAMTHNAGFGDYLENYEQAIAKALSEGKALPENQKAEDFLPYAQTELLPLDSGNYSNLGLLLVGLAIQHQCKDKSFDELLQEKILQPAHMDLSRSKPPSGKYDAHDPAQGLVKGGPSGGYWTTSSEFLKLGSWFQEKCASDPDFKSKVEKYGQEFYDADDKEIRHNGFSSAGSSFFSTFLQNGVTISILSDQGDKMVADRIYYTIRKHMIETAT